MLLHILPSIKSERARGCWNCRFAEINGKRPSRYVPGTRYRAGCSAPQRRTPGATGTIVMVEEQPARPVCPWHVEI